jgi:hypothetical protein
MLRLELARDAPRGLADGLEEVRECEPEVLESEARALSRLVACPRAVVVADRERHKTTHVVRTPGD